MAQPRPMQPGPMRPGRMQPAPPSGRGPSRPFLARTLNTDGRAHPKENAFAMATAVLGLVAIITAIWDDLHLVSSWTGLAGLLTGAWGQMISATTGERFVTVIGLGAAGVGFFLGMAHGGLFGGVIG